MITRNKDQNISDLVTKKIIVISENIDLYNRIKQRLDQIPLQINLLHTNSISQLLESSEEKNCDMIFYLLEHQQLDPKFKLLKKGYESTPVIIFSEKEDINSAVIAIKAGAQDYLSLNNLSSDMLLRTILHTSEQSLLQKEFNSISIMHQEIISHASDAIIVINQKGIVIQYNNAAEKLFGYTREEVLSKNVINIIPPSFRSKHNQSLQEYNETGIKKIIGEGYFEFDILNKEGKKIPIELSLSESIIDNEVIITAFIRDISERKEKDRQLRKIYNLLQYTARIGQIENVEINLSTNKTYFITPSSINIIETESNIVDNDELLKRIHPDDLSYVKESVKTAMAKKKNCVCEFRMIDQKSNILDILAKFEYFVEDDIPKFIGTVQNLTELRSMENRLRLYAEGINSSPVMVLITDNYGNIEFVNEKFLQNTGYTEEEVLGKNPRFLKSGVPQKTYEEMWRTISSGNIWEGEFENKKKDGTIFSVLATISPIFNQKGEIINYIEMLKDITKEKLMEKKFLQSQRLEAIGRLAAGIAHDFKNILTIISLNADILYEELQEQFVLKEEVSEIKEVVSMANSIVERLTSFTKDKEIQLKPLDLEKLIRKVKSWMNRFLGSSIQLILKLEANNPLIMGDETLFQQVLVNLLLNAKEAMPDGGKIEFNLTNLSIRNKVFHLTSKDDDLLKQIQNDKEHILVSDGDYVLIRIKDYGIGIEDENLKYIFEPFFTTKEKGGGTGLGLSTVYGIIKQLNGFIHLESKVGIGTQFFILIPCG